MLKKIIPVLVVLVAGLIFSGCTLQGQPAGLLVDANETANVFIDGKMVGKTPYTNKALSGKSEVTVKLIPEITDNLLLEWEGKVKLTAGTWTSIKRELAASESGSAGQVLYMEKTRDKNQASLSVISNPDGATVLVNGEDKGTTPLRLDSLEPGDYEIEIKKDGYINRTVKVKLLAGYLLTADVKLAQGQNLEESVELQPTGSVTPTTTQTTPAAKPTAQPTQSSQEVSRPYVLIKETEVGFLRVRAQPSTSSDELAQVKPKEKYPLLDEQNGWYQIEYQKGKNGWVAGQYVTKYE